MARGIDRKNRHYTEGAARNALCSPPRDCQGRVDLRTLWIILCTIFVTLLVVAGGSYTVAKYVWHSNEIVAEVNDWGHLEITSRSLQPVYVIGVAFNDRGMNECTPRPGPNFFTKEYIWFDQRKNEWYSHWLAKRTVALEEGRTAVVPFDRRQCGDKIVKAVVFTNLGNFTFHAPRPLWKDKVGASPAALHQGW
jgi:hypothetical protein